MKKIIALFIPLIMVMTTALTAHAFDPLPPEQQVVYNFKQYYKQQTGYQDLAEIRCVPMENCPGAHSATSITSFNSPQTLGWKPRFFS